MIPIFMISPMGQSRYATNIAAEQLRCANINMNAGVLGVSMPHSCFQRCDAAYWADIGDADKLAPSTAAPSSASDPIPSALWIRRKSLARCSCSGVK